MYPPLSNDITTASANDEYPALDYYNSPFLQDHDGVILSYLLSQQHFSTVADATSNNSSQPSQQAAELSFAEGNKELVKEMVKKTPISSNINKKKKKVAAPRKRASGKKDRHSKICTAQGQRDRRMRLSVQIARKFFDLQDMLGFDKASKTIEWLITKSKSAIKELKHHLVLPSYSTCTTESSEVVSNTLETRDPKNKHVRKFRRVAKGSRDEARARARERTREKLRIRSSQDHKANPNNDLGLCSEQGETNSLRMSNTNDHKTLTGRSSRSGPHFEEDGEFAGLTGNWGNIDSTRMQSFRGTMTTNVMKSSTGNSVLQIENPSTPIMGTTTTTRYTKQQEPGSSTSSLFSYTSSNYSQEQCYSGTSVFLTPPLNTQEVLDPCSVDFMPNQDQDHDHNHNSIFITTIISQNQNPGQFLKFNQDHFKFI